MPNRKMSKRKTVFSPAYAIALSMSALGFVPPMCPDTKTAVMAVRNPPVRLFAT